MTSTSSTKKLSLTLLAVVGVILYGVLTFMPLGPSGGAAELPSVRDRIGKDAALDKAREFVAELESPGEANAAAAQIAYDTNKHMNGYLVRYGLESEYAGHYADRYPLEYYKAEFESDRFRYYVYVSLFEPKVIGWVKETSGNAQEDRQTEEKLAREYLRAKGINPDTSALHVRTPQSALEPDLGAFSPRKAYRFTETSAVVGEAELVRTVYIHDGQIVGYREGFEPPLHHRDWQERQDGISAMLSLAFYGLLLAFCLTALILAIINRKQASFTRGAALSIVVGILTLLHHWNMSPVLLAMKGDVFYPDIVEWIETAFTLSIELLLIVGLYFIFVAGEEMTRQVGWNLWTHPRSPRFAEETITAMKRGYKIALFMIGVQAFMFFVAESYFGMWSINDPQTSSLNLRFIWLYPVVAWIAAFQEEAIFRLFGISIVYRITRSKWAAVILTSFVWSIGHAAYPLYPFYTRIWEVTLFGLLFGFAYLRYGFWTVVFAHAAANSLMTAVELITIEPSPIHIASAAVFAASPFLVALAMSAWTKRRSGRGAPTPPAMPNPPA